MRWAWAVVAMWAGTAGAQAPPAFLTDAGQKDLEQRTQQSFDGGGWLDRDGKVAVVREGGGPLEGPRELVVVEATAQRVRVITENHEVRLAVWLEVGHLAVVTVSAALLLTADAPIPGAEAAALRFRGGLRLGLGKPGKTGRLPVRYRDDDLEARGFIDPAMLGKVYTDEDWQPIRGGLEIKRNTRLFDAPDGRLMARFRGKETVLVDWTGKRSQGFWLVSWGSYDVRVTGWIRDADRLEWIETGRMGFGRSHGYPRIQVGGRQVKLPKDTLLRAVDGEVVGLVRQDAWFSVAGPERRGEAPLVLVRTSLGAAKLQPELPEIRFEP